MLTHRAKSLPRDSVPTPRHPSLLLLPVQRQPYKFGTSLPTLAREKPSESDYDDMAESSAKSRKVEESSASRTRMMMSLTRSSHVVNFACIILRFI